MGNYIIELNLKGMWKNLSQVSASATTDHTQTSTIVCVTQVRANKLAGDDA